jgi:hypothetical protein
MRLADTLHASVSGPHRRLGWAHRVHRFFAKVFGGQ